MTEPTILIVPKQGLTVKDKRDLAKIGVVVLEMDDPHQARLIKPTAELSSTDLLGAAARVIRESGSSTIKSNFSDLVCGMLERKRPVPQVTTPEASTNTNKAS